MIFGAGGFGREVLQIVRDIERHRQGSWQPVAFFVDPSYAAQSTGSGLPLLTDVGELQRDADLQVFIAVGSPADRQKISRRLSWLPDDRFATLVHPGAYVGRLGGIGAGSIVCPGAVLTTDISIGRHVQIHAGVTIAHDTLLDDFVTVYPGARISGQVSLRLGAELGTGSVVLPKSEVGSWSIVGAGAIITKAVPEDTVVVGNPGRVIKQRPKDWHT